MFPKHKNKEKQTRGGGAPVVLQGNDQEIAARIYRHASAIRARGGASDDQLSLIARSIVKYARANGVEPELGAALIGRESRYNPNAMSSHGACGLGQLMPGTASRWGASDCHDIDQNVSATFAYLRNLMNLYQDSDVQTDCALAAYLRGPGNTKCNGKLWQNSTISTYLKGVYEYRNAIKAR
jgi:soluble lytic murein transglycosylase-like protein